MAFEFAPHKLAELAAELAGEGAKFYEYLKALADSFEVKETFEMLSRHELSHQQAFRETAEAVGSETSVSAYPDDIYGQMKTIIEELKAGEFNIANPVKISMNLAKTLELAIHLEKESIRFYTEMRNNFPENYRRILDLVVDQKKAHLNTLLELKVKY